MALCGTLAAAAQELTEDFSGNSLPSGWNNSYQQGAGSAWNFSGGRATVTNTVPLSGQAAGPSWLITRNFVPGPGHGTIVFNASFAAVPPLGSSSFTVRITNGSSTNYGGYAILLTIDRALLTGSANQELRVKIPKSYWGQNCFAAFTHGSSGLLSTDNVSVDNIRLETDPIYSVANGDASGAVWSETMNGAASAVDFTQNHSLVVQSGTTVHFTKDADIFNITINPGASLFVKGSELSTLGDISNKGFFNGRGGKLAFDGTSGQFVDGSLLAGDVAVNNFGGVEILSGNFKLAGELSFKEGSYLITNDHLTLLSDDQGTGSIGPMNGTVLIGNVTQQRFVPAGQTDWRFISSPMDGMTLNDLNDDLVTSGFPGADKPNLSFISAYSYFESRPGSIENGFVAATNITNPLTPGNGYYIYSGDSAQGPGAFTLDFTGSVNQGQFELPLSYTNNGAPIWDGFNLIGNPYPSSIDFSKLDLNQTDAKYWIYDPVSGNSDMWNQKAGVGLMRANGKITSVQGFFVKARGAGASVVINEGDKTTGGNGVFLQAKSDKVLISAMLKQSSGKLYDAAVFNVNAESMPEFDEFDSEKIEVSNPDAPKLAMIESGRELGIDTRPSVNPGDTVKLYIKARKSGDHLLTFNAIQNLDAYYPVLVNLSNGTRQLIDDNFALTLNLNRNVVVQNYVIVFDQREKFAVKSNRCNNDGSGYLAARGPGAGPYNYVWKNAEGSVVQEAIGVTIADTLRAAQSGIYTVEIQANGYPVKTSDLQFVNPALLVATVRSNNETCPENNDGALYSIPSGGTGAITVKWSNGATTYNVGNVPSGAYTITLVDSLNCKQSYGPIEITEPDTLRASIASVVDTVDVNEVFSLTSTANRPVTEFHWTFGDGNESTDESPSHVYSSSGTFTVKLEISNGFCQANSTRKITARSGVGIAENSTDGLRVEVTDGMIRVTADQKYDAINVFSIDGRLVLKELGMSRGEVKELKINTSARGIYVVSLMVGEKASCRRIQL